MAVGVPEVNVQEDYNTQKSLRKSAVSHWLVERTTLLTHVISKRTNRNSASQPPPANPRPRSQYFRSPPGSSGQ